MSRGSVERCATASSATASNASAHEAVEGDAFAASWMLARIACRVGILSFLVADGDDLPFGVDADRASADDLHVAGLAVERLDAIERSAAGFYLDVLFGDDLVLLIVFAFF